jgi:hypothetical protein
MAPLSAYPENSEKILSYRVGKKYLSILLR